MGVVASMSRLPKLSGVFCLLSKSPGKTGLFFKVSRTIFTEATIFGQVSVG